MKNSMFMKYILPAGLILVIIFAILLSRDDKSGMMDTSLGQHEVVVNEVIQTNSYTYLEVSEKKNNFWMAIARQAAAVGDKFYFNSALEMVDFESKELDRVFHLIYFIQDVNRESGGRASDDVSIQGMQKPTTAFDESNNIQPPKDGISIAELFKDQKDYSNKKVKVKGKVVKVNVEIMGRNWVHIQDGTQTGGNYDLTITTMETVNVDDVLTFEGTITLNKDFGAGYSYALIMEDGILINLP